MCVCDTCPRYDTYPIPSPDAGYSEYGGQADMPSPDSGWTDCTLVGANDAPMADGWVCYYYVQ